MFIFKLKTITSDQVFQRLIMHYHPFTLLCAVSKYETQTVIGRNNFPFQPHKCLFSCIYLFSPSHGKISLSPLTSSWLSPFPFCFLQLYFTVFQQTISPPACISVHEKCKTTSVHANAYLHMQIRIKTHV